MSRFTRIIVGIQRFIAFVCSLCTIGMGYCGIYVLFGCRDEEFSLIVGIVMLLITVLAGYATGLMWKDTSEQLKEASYKHNRM